MAAAFCVDIKKGPAAVAERPLDRLKEMFGHRRALGVGPD